MLLKLIVGISLILLGMALFIINGYIWNRPPKKGIGG